MDFELWIMDFEFKFGDFEIRNPALDFGFWISDFERIMDFDFEISKIAPPD